MSNNEADRKKKESRPPELSCTELELGYDGKALVSHLNFEVRHGDYLCIVGENGAGKSTLMRTILGLQKPMSGEVRYGDGLSSRMIGYLPQQTEVQRDFPASVREIVLSGFQARLGRRFFYSAAERAAALDNMRLASKAWRMRAFRRSPAGRSSVSCSRVRFLRAEGCFSWTNRWRDWILRHPKTCTG